MNERLKNVICHPRKFYSKCVRSLIWKIGKIRLSRRGLTSLFDHLDSDAHPPEWHDLWALYKLVKDQKPKLILEYGSGCSTLIMAQALAENGGGKLISVEANEKWANHTLQNLPDRLKSYVELRVLKPQILVRRSDSESKGARSGYQQAWLRADSIGLSDQADVVTVSYAELHSLKPDMIYLDGPSPHDIADYPRQESGKPLPVIVSDILFMYKHLPRPFTLIVDGRRFNCEFINENLPIPLHVRYNKYHRQTTFQAHQDASSL